MMADLQEILTVAYAHHRTDHLPEAEKGYRRVLELDEEHPDALFLLGILLKDRNRRTEAQKFLASAVLIAPQNKSAWLELTRLHHDDANWQACIKAADQTLALSQTTAENEVEVELMRGSAYMALRNFSEAALSGARAIAAAPDNADLHLFYVRCLMALNRFKDALPSAKAAAQLSRRSSEAHFVLGACLKRCGQTDDSESPLLQALDLDPRNFKALNDLADVYIARGDAARAVDCLRQSHEISPYNLDAISGLCFYGVFDHRLSAEALFKINQGWSRQLNELARDHKFPPTPERRNEKIHVAYIANDFFDNVTSWFLEPVLANYDRSQFYVTCYSGGEKKDSVTRRLASLVDCWREIDEEDIAGTADQIRCDGVDILVLSSFFRGKDRRIMAYRSAPLQVGYLNRVSSTGLDTLDYIITESGSDPIGDVEATYSETLVRLSSHNTYKPANVDAAPRNPPCLENGFITFGSFNNHAKINVTVIHVWAKILQALPDSRLLLRSSRYFENPITCAFFQERFAAVGVGAERLDFQGFRATRQEHLRDLNDADIALDPFPCNGGTTTCEALWMGLPLVTMKANSYMGRQGASYLSKLGLQDLICETPNDYVDAACNLAGDIDRIRHLRGSLRTLVEEKLFNHHQHIQELELAYETMWARRNNNQPCTPFLIQNDQVTVL
jgi:protein O-GlcNAc transferase